jgi:membrane fusion protein (multidrug efflux system)
MRLSHPLLMVLTAAILAVALGAGCSKKDGAPAAPAGAGGPPGGGMPPLPVEVITLKPQSLAGGLETVGSLRADESVVVRPEIAGRISHIHFTEGGRVAAGQPLFTLDGSLALASLNEAAANLENSRRSAGRAGELAQDKLIAQADYDKARASLGVDQARVASARTTLSKMTLRAPFSGQIGLREVSVGEFVTVGQALVTLVRLDPIEVDFSVPEGALTQLHDGQKIQVTLDAFPGDVFDGEVVAIAPVIDANSRSVKLRAQIPNPDFKLRPGQFAKLQLDTGTGSSDALLIPEQALMQDGDMRFVYTVVAGKAKKAVIKTGARVPGQVRVTDGLKAGDVVITAGQTKPLMHDGLDVMPLPPEGATGAPKPPAGAAQQQDKPQAASAPKG